MSFDALSPGNGTAQRLASGCHELDGLLRALGPTAPEEPDGTLAPRVHAVRKLCKSLRGGFALIGLEKSAGREIQAVGRLLAASRDTVSRRQTWDRLGWDDGSLVAAAIIALLEEQMATAATRKPSAVIAWCCERVARAAASIAALDPASLDECVATGLENLDHSVIKRCQRLSRRGEQDFHNARKALKAHLGAISFLHGLHGKSALDPLRVKLAELLGDENDLATLRQWLTTHGFTSAFAPELRAKIAKRQEKLRARAIKDALAIAGVRRRTPTD